MFDRLQEEQHLVEADRHIANAEERIGQSMDRLDLLRAKKLSTKQEEMLLVLLLQTLGTMHRYRKQILERLKDAK